MLQGRCVTSEAVRASGCKQSNRLGQRSGNGLPMDWIEGPPQPVWLWEQGWGYMQANWRSAANAGHARERTWEVACWAALVCASWRSPPHAPLRSCRCRWRQSRSVLVYESMRCSGQRHTEKAAAQLMGTQRAVHTHTQLLHTQALPGRSDVRALSTQVQHARRLLSHKPCARKFSFPAEGLLMLPLEARA